MKKIIIGLGLFFFIVFVPQNADASTSNFLSKHGITWTFTENVEYGQFANGDYWVLGPVTISSISPDFDGLSNGWQVNPSVSSSHGFDAGCKNDNFDASLVPNLPYTATG